MVSHRDQILFIVFLLPYLVQPAEYHAVGSNVTLHTGYGGNDLVSVDWDHGENNAVKWFENKFTAYSIFKGRTHLNLTNGDLTLIGVTWSESGNYTVSLNGKGNDTKHFIKVIQPVPTVNKATVPPSTAPPSTAPPTTAPPSPAERNRYFLLPPLILAVILAVILLRSFIVHRPRTEVWGKRKDEGNGSPIPLVDKNENNLESSATTQDEDDAV